MASEMMYANLLKNYGIDSNHVPRPRAPPRLIRPPSPIITGRYQPIVPDVSLIMDSAATSMISNSESIAEESGNGTMDVSSRQHTSSGSNRDMDDCLASNFANYYPTPTLNPTSNNQKPELFQTCQQEESEPLAFAALPRPNNCNCSKGTDKNQSQSSTSAGFNPKQPQNKSENAGEKLERDLESLKSDLASVLKIVGQQNFNILKLESQVQQIIAFQQKFLSGMLIKSGVSKAIQTDESPSNPQTPDVTTTPIVEKVAQVAVPEQNHDTNETHVTEPLQMLKDGGQHRPPSAISKPTQQNSTLPRTMSVNRNSDLKTRLGATSSVADKNTEDFSTILRNLQISEVQAPSQYSQTSIQSLEFPQFGDNSFRHDDSAYIGPSASAYGSSSEDEGGKETVVPSVSYYNNLFSTVNRILDGGPATKRTKKKNSEVDGKRMLPSSDRDHDLRNANKGNTNNSGNSPISSGSSSSSSCTMSYTSGSSFGYVGKIDGDAKDNGCQPILPTDARNHWDKRHSVPYSNSNAAEERGTETDNVADATKKYLQSLGVHFDSPAPPNSNGHQDNHPTSSAAAHQQQNYMIQQNVYNSIYIPTVNCAPVVESLHSNNDFIDSLGPKYLPPSELNQYEINKGKNENGHTETTVYGMSANNLSFSTKEYLQRYGLVDSSNTTPNQIVPTSSVYRPPFSGPCILPTSGAQFHNKPD